MAHLNKFQVIGNLGRDPELRYSEKGKAVARINVAVTTPVSKDKQPITDWFQLVAFDQTAELLSKYAKKGSQLYIEARLKPQKWQDAAGNDQYNMAIIVDSFQLLGSAPGRQAGNGNGSEAPAQEQGSRPPAEMAPGTAKLADQLMDDLDDDIPF